MRGYKPGDTVFIPSLRPLPRGEGGGFYDNPMVGAAVVFQLSDSVADCSGEMQFQFVMGRELIGLARQEL